MEENESLFEIDQFSVIKNVNKIHQDSELFSL